MRTNPEHVSLLVITTSTSYAALHLLVSFVSGAPHGARAHQGLSPAALKFVAYARAGSEVSRYVSVR